MKPIRIGTRGSRLALWQANDVAARLRPLAASRPVELVVLQTSGDRLQETPLAQIGGDGIFTKEIQRALLDGRVDVAVHSLKDLPTIPVEGVVLAAVPERGPSADVFVSGRYGGFDALPAGAVVGSGSLRRKAQALYRRPDLRLVDMRGNVETRLRKLEQESLDGVILAQAGLERLGLGKAITECLDLAWMLPAVGQGALGLECRADDEAVSKLLVKLDHPPSRQAVLAERSLLRALGGGCQIPLGALGRVSDDHLLLRAAVFDPRGAERLVGEAEGPADDADGIGRRLAVDLLSQGARRILMEGNETPAASPS